MTTSDSKLSPLVLSNSRNLVWATDVHLDWTKENPGKLKEFAKSIRDLKPDLLLLTGDIDFGKSYNGSLGVLGAVKKIQELVKCPVFFVLGNHDFWYDSFENVRKRVRSLTLEKENIFYLSRSKPVELNTTTALLGIDGWFDGRAGNLLKTNTYTNDFKFINDLDDDMRINTQEMKNKLTNLPKPGVKYVEKTLPKLFEVYDKVILGTHMPPFSKACYNYKKPGKLSDEHNLPFEANVSLGEKLLEIMKKFPHKELLVLCGHTHHHCDYSPLKNLRVLVGGATYGTPQPQKPVSLLNNSLNCNIL